MTPDQLYIQRIQTRIGELELLVMQLQIHIEELEKARNEAPVQEPS